MIGGYLVASLAAGITLNLEIALVGLLTGAPVHAGTLYMVVVLGIIVSPIVATVAWVPVVGPIVYAERRSIRSPSFYAAVGAFAALVLICVAYGAGLFEESDASIPQPAIIDLLPPMLMLFLLPALSGGLAYWAIAGRTAGLTKR